MLPADIVNNPHVRSFVVMPLGAQDVLQQEERWERKPHPDDKPAAKGHPPVYHGEWENKTALAKAEWELRKAELELIKLEKQQRLAEQRAKREASDKRKKQEDEDDDYYDTYGDD